MKKFTKISLVVAALMLGFGVLLCGIASLYGGGYGTLRHMANEGAFDRGNWHIRSDGIYYDDVDDVAEWDDVEDLEELERAENLENPVGNAGAVGRGANAGMQATYDSVSVKNIRFEIDAARVLVQGSRDLDKITVELRRGNEEYFDSVLENDTLTITYNKPATARLNHNDTVIVLIPQASAFNELQFLLGAAMVEMDDVNVSCNELYAEVGAGKMEAEWLTVLETAEVSVDAGEVSLDDSSFKDVNVSCGMGKIELGGIVDGNLTGNCEMGNIEIDLTGRESDYNYDLSCAMGRLTVNGRNYAGIDQEHYNGNNGAKGTIQLSCEMGSIELEIEID